MAQASAQIVMEPNNVVNVMDRVSSTHLDILNSTRHVKHVEVLVHVKDVRFPTESTLVVEGLRV